MDKIKKTYIIPHIHTCIVNEDSLLMVSLNDNKENPSDSWAKEHNFYSDNEDDNDSWETKTTDVMQQDNNKLADSKQLVKTA